jgi:hypothetical protein
MAASRLARSAKEKARTFMTTRGDRKSFRNEDLVLKVTPHIDPSVWDESKYEGFLDELCGTREYQKEAV